MASDSMLPTIANKSRVAFVPYSNVNYAKPGDIVVFRHPINNNLWIKRLIGMPGDKVQMKEGRLYINGDLVPRQPISKVHTKDFYGSESDVPTYRETLPNGVSYTIIEIEGDSGANDNTHVFEVPPGNYFVMGDNRDNSTDSRIAPEQEGVGFVPSRNIIGYVIALAQDWEKPWSFVKSKAARDCAKTFDSYQLQAVCMDNEKTAYEKMQGNFGMPEEVASKAKERCAKIFENFQLQAVCMENEQNGFNQMKKY